MGDSLIRMSGVEKSVRLARQYALDSNYDVAIAFYSGLDRDFAVRIQSCSNPDERERTTLLREKIAKECSLVKSIQEELKALVNVSDALRLDRVRQGGDGTSITQVSPLTRQAKRGSFPDHAGTTAQATQPVKSRAINPQVPPPPPTAQNLPDSLGMLNQVLYGDKDRFGPPEGPLLRQQKPSNVRKTPQRCVTPVARRRQNVGAAPTKPLSPCRNTKAKTNARRVERTVGNEERSVIKRTNVPRFAPRAGEEELASLIEADMHVGPMPVSWKDIAGLDEAKGLLEEAVVYPVLMPDYYQGIRRPWKGVLLYGPPGTGKTMLAKAVASECNTTFFNVSPATLTSKWRGDSEKLIRVLFEMARHYAPSTIFIDEIDSLCGHRGDGNEHEASRRAKGTLLAQMDGVGVDPGKIVMVLGATNHPWSIDEAMRRRLEKRIYIPLPDFHDRVELFRINTQSLKLSTDVDFTHLSKMVDGRHYSCADITNLVRDAAMMTMRRFMEEMDKSELKQRAAEIGKLVADQPTTMQDFLSAVKNVPSSINVEQVAKFEKWKKEFETNL